MVPSLTADVLPLEVDADGVVRIGKTRVTLDIVIEAFTEGATAEEIVQQYPPLRLADVYQAIGYYLRHQPDVDAYLAERRTRADAVRKENEARSDLRGIRERLLARRGSRGE